MSAIRLAMTDGSRGSSSGNCGRVICFSLTYNLPNSDTSSAPPAPWRASSAWRLVLARIHRVPQSIPDKGKTKHRQGDGQCREESQIPVDADVLRAVGDHFTETRRRLVDADAEETQPRFGKYRGWDGQGDGDDQGRQRIRQHVADGDPRFGHAESSRRLYELLFAQHQELRSRQPAECHPACHPDRDDD